jgi:hypothetical protein
MSLLTGFLFLFSTLIVQARVLDNVTSKMRFIFFNLSGTQAFTVWLKVAMFIIIFAVLYNGGLKALKAEGPMKNALAVITFIIALTSAIFVPYTLLLYIFRLYSAILIILFAMLPALIGFMFNHTLFNGDSRMYKILRAVIYFLITIFIFGVIGTVDTLSSPEKVIYEQILEPLTYGAIIAFIAGLFNILMAMGGDKIVDAIGNKISGGGSTTPHATTPTSPGATTPPATPTTPAPPAPNPGQINLLQQEIANFVNILGEFPNSTATPPITASGLCQELEQLMARHISEIRSAPTDVARRAAAPGHMPRIHNTQQILGNLRYRMDTILQ